jgi:hypothetical protein
VTDRDELEAVGLRTARHTTASLMIAANAHVAPNLNGPR